MVGLVDRLRVVVDHAVDVDGIPGAAVAIVDGGTRSDIVVGVHDLSGTPLTAQSVGRYYSSVKVITSVVIMQLVEAGVFAPDTSIDALLPEWEDAVFEPAPTVRQLLTHTAGLTYPAPVGAVGADPDDRAYRDAGINHFGEQSLYEFSARIAAQAPCFAPGTACRYSLSHDLLGRVIEHTTDHLVRDVFHAQIFEPLGMLRSSLAPDPAIIDGLGDCWVHDPSGSPSIVHDDPAGSRSRFANERLMTSAGGGFFSTLDDYVRFVQMLLAGGVFGGTRVISAEGVDTILANQLQPEVLATAGLDGGFGFGGRVSTGEETDVMPAGVFSWGGYGGTGYLVDRANDLTVCLHMQVCNDLTLPLWGQLVEATYGPR